MFDQLYSNLIKLAQYSFIALAIYLWIFFSISMVVKMIKSFKHEIKRNPEPEKPILRDYMKQLTNCKNRIDTPEICTLIEQLQQTGSFSEATYRKHSSSYEKFADVYMPRLIKVLENYIDMPESTAKEENVRTICSLLSSYNKALQKISSGIAEASELDIQAETAALTQSLANRFPEDDLKQESTQVKEERSSYV